MLDTPRRELSRARVLLAGSCVALLALPAACSDSSETSTPATTIMTTTTAELPGGERGTPTGDPNVDAVLQLLESDPTVPFTAGYSIVRRLGDVATEATVAADDTGRRSVTVGDVRFLTDGEGSLTCVLGGAESCEEGTLDARVSDTGVTSGFFADTPARRLRVAWARSTGDTTAETADIAGVDASCVTVPIGDGSETYCAAPAGILARWAAADVLVELALLVPTADDERFLHNG